MQLNNQIRLETGRALEERSEHIQCAQVRTTKTLCLLNLKYAKQTKKQISAKGSWLSETAALELLIKDTGSHIQYLPTRASCTSPSILNQPTRHSTITATKDQQFSIKKLT
jgi:hypothetical protein